MPLTTPTPQHTHDCDDCVFIAQLGKDDIYVCATEMDRGEDSLIARDGSEGGDYASFPVSIARMAADMDPNWDLRVRLYDAFIAGRNSL